ncbi:hypothetical protein ABKN59_003485 [Abortiporus biennis]
MLQCIIVTKCRHRKCGFNSKTYGVFVVRRMVNTVHSVVSKDSSGCHPMPATEARRSILFNYYDNYLDSIRVQTGSHVSQTRPGIKGQFNSRRGNLHSSGGLSEFISDFRPHTSFPLPSPAFPPRYSCRQNLLFCEHLTQFFVSACISQLHPLSLTFSHSSVAMRNFLPTYGMPMTEGIETADVNASSWPQERHREPSENGGDHDIDSGYSLPGDAADSTLFFPVHCPQSYSLMQLPSELLFMIVFLLDTYSLFSISLVAKLFAEATRSRRFHSIVICDEVQGREFMGFIDSFGAVASYVHRVRIDTRSLRSFRYHETAMQQLRVENFLIWVLNDVLPHLHNIETLSFSNLLLGERWDPVNSKIEQVISSFGMVRHLEGLQFNNCEMELSTYNLIIGTLVNVETLQLENTGVLGTRSAHAHINRNELNYLCNLRSLKISQSGVSRANFVSYLGLYCLCDFSKMEKLVVHLNGFGSNTWIWVAKLLKLELRVQELELKVSNLAKTEGIFSIISLCNLRKLRILKIDNLFEYPDVAQLITSIRPKSSIQRIEGSISSGIFGTTHYVHCASVDWAIYEYLNKLNQTTKRLYYLYIIESLIVIGWYRRSPSKLHHLLLRTVPI